MQNTIGAEEFWDLSGVDFKANLIPDGKYTALITGIEKKDTKEGNGVYVRFEFTLTSQGVTGRKIYENFNIVNKNPEAVKIGKRNLGLLCIAAGYTEDQARKVSPSMLSNKEVGVTVKTKQNKEGIDESRITSYVPVSKLPEHAKVSNKDVTF